MTSISENNKRIAKNTLFLYFRTMLMMGVSLYTSRVVLNALGVVDYGLNNVVAGVITLFSFLNNALGASSSRFLTFELGKKNTERIKEVFRTSFNIHAGLAVIVVIFCETAGLWIVNHVLVIPPERLFACNVIYQYVVISAALSITQVPLNAMIISHERMNLYAYIGISDAVLKLAVAYLIMISSFDKLITLGTLNLVIMAGMYLFYHIYCKRNFAEYTIAVSKNKPLYKEMLSYSIWSLLGSTAVMLKNQGVNILINIFFGPMVNAANAIAYQVNSALTNFSNNFMTALNPQIIKSYASNDRERMKSLIFRGGKFSFFLLMFLSIPILLETDMVLKLWLNNVPEFTVVLTRLVILLTLTECFIYTLGTAIQATGNIRNYQLIVSGTIIFNFPLSFLFYKLGCEPSVALIISIILSLITVFIRVIFIQKILNITFFEYVKNVLFRCFFVFAFSILPPFWLHTKMTEGIERLLFVIMLAIFSCSIFIYFVGLKNIEKQYIVSLIKSKKHFLLK